jgi:hypothetical protein
MTVEDPHVSASEVIPVNGNPLLRVVVRAEQAVASPVNRASNSGLAAHALLVVARGGKLAQQVAERFQSAVVHALDLPSHRDLQLLAARVERLQRTVEDWSVEARGRQRS